MRKLGVLYTNTNNNYSKKYTCNINNDINNKQEV